MALTRRSFAVLPVGLAAAGSPASGAALRLRLRSRVEAFKGSGIWTPVELDQELPISQTAILICDMWDNHWCKGAATRVEVLARKMAPLIDRARGTGLQIVHSPSDVMDFYKDTPERRRAMEAARVAPPAPIELTDPPLPIDDSDGGCDTPEKFYKAWSRQHAAIRVTSPDIVSDNGAEVYSFLRARGIGNLLVMGVHTNMCVLKRTFAIRQMTRWGVRCVLVRDLTDAMYDPNDRPFVTHDRGTELVVEHIEKYWCPTVLSPQVLAALGSLKSSLGKSS